MKNLHVQSVVEVAGSGATFSDSDSAPVPKFLDPGPDPAILQIWESDSCSDSGYNIRSNRDLPLFLPKKWLHRLCHCRNGRVTPDLGPVFLKLLTPGPKGKRRILPQSTPASRIRSHPWSVIARSKFNLHRSAEWPLRSGFVEQCCSCVQWRSYICAKFW